MLSYSQSTGVLTMPNGQKYTGHAGKGVGLNNPDMQHIRYIGPLPQGFYTLGVWQDGKKYGPGDAKLGPFVCRLTPSESNKMFGRDGFFFHGGDGSEPPTDSEGCIVLFRAARNAIAASGETRLHVVE